MPGQTADGAALGIADVLSCLAPGCMANETQSERGHQSECVHSGSVRNEVGAKASPRSWTWNCCWSYLAWSAA